MNRRGFISMMAGAAGALVLPKWRIPDPVIVLPADFSTDNMLYKATERYSIDFADWRGFFGSAPVKAEGSAIAYDGGVALTSMLHPLVDRIGWPRWTTKPAGLG